MAIVAIMMLAVATPPLTLPISRPSVLIPEPSPNRKTPEAITTATIILMKVFIPKLQWQLQLQLRLNRQEQETGHDRLPEVAILVL